MRYFPIFYDSKCKKLLLIGGGSVAMQKLEVLSKFEFEITVIAKKISNEVLKYCQENSLILLEREFDGSDLDDFDMVIAATNDNILHKKIEALCYKKRLLNCVDAPQFCDFFFASIVEKEGIVIALSSQGKAPSVVKALKQKIADAIPNGTAQFIDKITKLKESMPSGKERMQMIKKMTNEWISS